MSSNQPRQSKGTPAGGQWRATERPEGNVHLSGPPAAGDEPDGCIPTTAGSATSLTAPARSSSGPKVVRTGESHGITRYDVFVGGEKVGQVIKVAGRSFSGAWRGDSVSGKFVNWRRTRREVVELLVELEAQRCRLSRLE